MILRQEIFVMKESLWIPLSDEFQAVNWSESLPHSTIQEKRQVDKATQICCARRSKEGKNV